MKITAFFDGACEPRNPGGAMGIGTHITINEEPVLQHSAFIAERKTNSNNVAEYLAFEKILDYLIENKLTNVPVRIYGDSMLVIRQMQGVWQMKGGLYFPVALRCVEKINLHFNRANLMLQWVGRGNNALADRLSKMELIKHNIQFKIQPNEYR
jgi:ribonuclease HI